MKNKKLSLPAIILLVAVLVIAVFSLISAIAKKPNITEGEFPFSITYELDGETKTINDVYRARYNGNGGYADSKSRLYVGEIGNMREGNTVFTLKSDESGRIELWTHFHADYMMGDTEYDYSDVEPKIYYYDTEENEYHDEETLSSHGVKLIDFEYPSPIKNSFTFSHLSHLSGAVVMPTFIISLLALLAIIIFVKKDKELKYKAVDVVSIVLNVIVGTVFLFFVTMLALLIDIEGGSPEFYHQAMHFIPSFFLLCIAASVALRRTGYAVKSLVSALVAPAGFALYLLICILQELL